MDWLLFERGKKFLEESDRREMSASPQIVVGAVLASREAMVREEGRRLSDELRLGEVAIAARRSSQTMIWRTLRYLAKHGQANLSQLRDGVLGSESSDEEWADLAADLTWMVKRRLLVESIQGNYTLEREAALWSTGDPEVAELLQEAIRSLLNDVWPNVAEGGEAGRIVVAKVPIPAGAVSSTITALRDGTHAILKQATSDEPNSSWITVVMGAARVED